MQVGTQAIRRIASAAGVTLVDGLTAWTDEYFGLTQGLCIAAIVFIISTQLDHSKIQPRLLQRICVLYCNQEVRKLFVWDDYGPISVFSDILLAMLLAVGTMLVYDLRDDANTRELHRLLDGLLYLYGNILDFAFQYGIFKITLCAFGATVLLQRLPVPEGRMPCFCWQLARIVAANLLSEGMTTMVVAPFQLQLLQYLGSLCVLRLLLPDLQSYLIYLTAQQLQGILPGAEPLFFCAIILLDHIPTTSREWVEDLCCTYILLGIANFVYSMPIWATILLLVVAHYADHITGPSS